MEKPRVRIYTDYKSPYAFVANKRLFELEEEHGVELEWLPYTLRVAEFMGTVEERTPHFWRKVDSWNNERVHGSNVWRVVMQEGPPSLAGWRPSFDHVLCMDRPCGASRM